MRLLRLSAAVLAAVLMAAPVPVMAFGSSSKKSSAVTAKPGEAAYRKALKAIDRKDWQLAIFHLHKTVEANPAHADAENWLGYSYRKTEDFTNAFVHYDLALQLDPGHRGAHEYIGEAFLESGNLAKAQEHLAALERLCPAGCEEREDLAEAIERFRSGS